MLKIIHNTQTHRKIKIHFLNICFDFSHSFVMRGRSTKATNDAGR